MTRPPANWQLLALVLLASSAACRETPQYTGDERILAFDTAYVRLTSGRDTVGLLVELAVSREQKTLGLMERRQLADTAGMLFVYDSVQSPEAGFWMYRTRIPLDIAFFDSAGIIRSIRTMVPCETTIPEGCATYAPGVPYKYALEVKAGVFQRYNISEGDALIMADVPRPSAVPKTGS